MDEDQCPTCSRKVAALHSRGGRASEDGPVVPFLQWLEPCGHIVSGAEARKIRARFGSTDE
jgi:hypothetical protein